MSRPGDVALFAVTKRGIERARLLRQRLREGQLYRPAHNGPAEHAWEHPLEGSLNDAVRHEFSHCRQLVFFLAVGAVTRLIAPCLSSKEEDPGVLAVDEAGHHVIALLSGHRGGANAFARTVAGCLGATPVVTTASDLFDGLSLDLLEDTFGWTAEPRDQLKDAALALVNNEPIAVLQEIGTRGTWLRDMALPDHVRVVRSEDELVRFQTVLRVTDRAGTLETIDIGSIKAQRTLYYRPKSLVLGAGCERGLPLEVLDEGLTTFLAKHGYARSAIDTLASARVKVDEPALTALAQQEGWQTVFFDAEQLAAVPAIPTPSAVVQRCVGTPGVAEPAALLASGNTQLVVGKQVLHVAGCSQGMTFALARHVCFQPATAARGIVHFVGAGPGDPGLLTVRAAELLRQAEVVVYAGSLIPEGILRQAPRTAVLHNSAHLTLEQVMSILLEATTAGRNVVRLQSGDTSLYSAIQEQLALLEKAGVECDVVPGISAYQSLAAALKSELTLPEQVQTIILTRGEGNTPMPEKEKLAALAQHGATLCIYLSGRLARQVQDQLATAYPPETPVAIAHRVSWPDEEIVVTRLDQLAAEMAQHDWQRTTLIMVGAAIGARKRRSHLYDERHGHVFRKRTADQRERGTEGPAA